MIELSVVVLIIAMLIAIAVPTFLGIRRRAADKATQSNIRNVFVNAKVLHSDGGDYRSADASALSQAAPEIRIVDAPAASAGSDVVSVWGKEPGTWYATALAGTGECWALRDLAIGATGTSYAGYVPSDIEHCNPIWAETNLTPADWKSRWP